MNKIFSYGVGQGEYKRLSVLIIDLKIFGLYIDFNNGMITGIKLIK